MHDKPEMSEESAIWPDPESQLSSINAIAATLVRKLEALPSQPVASAVDREEVLEAIAKYDFQAPLDLDRLSNDVVALLSDTTVNVMHPGYFGLFNPSVTFPSIVADLIVAAVNPQLAAWSHAPAANEIEAHVIAAVAALFGWETQERNGHFTSGGAEANYTSLIVALTRANRHFGDSGAAAFGGQPRLYVSSESHLAWYKIAHQCGIGRDAVCLVPTDGAGRLDPAALSACIGRDRAARRVPVFIGATAGTTNAGEIDPLRQCADIARTEQLWFHVDAAWGGALAVLPDQRTHLAGIEYADSVTVDAHKWFAVPMAAGLFLCRDEDILHQAFRVTTDYMPAPAAGADPYTHSVQWSRRFIGLKFFLSLANLGWSGYRHHIKESLTRAAELRRLLTAAGWRVVNNSAVAVVCFDDPRQPDLDLGAIADAVVDLGRAWISLTRYEQAPVLRACITSHRTRGADLENLVADLEQARNAARE